MDGSHGCAAIVVNGIDNLQVDYGAPVVALSQRLIRTCAGRIRNHYFNIHYSYLSDYYRQRRQTGA
jgi:hypothetical protein